MVLLLLTKTINVSGMTQSLLGQLFLFTVYRAIIDGSVAQPTTSLGGPWPTWPLYSVPIPPDSNRSLRRRVFNQSSPQYATTICTIWQRIRGVLVHDNALYKLTFYLLTYLHNASARLIYRLRRSDHISDVLASLHCLRVPERIEYKIAVLVYKVLNGLAPRYLGPLTHVADLPGRRALRSASSNRLHILPVRLSTVGTRAFSVARPRIWNNLPEHITSAGTYFLSPAEDALVSAIIFLTFYSSRLNFTVTSSDSGPCSGFHHLGHFK